MAAVQENILGRLGNIKQTAQDNAMLLVFFPLFFMIFFGVIINDLGSSGINTSNTIQYQYTYPCVLGVGNCSLIAYIKGSSNPCANNMCNITQISGFQFLNQYSPFTFLIEGNIIGFISSFSSGANTNSSGSTNILQLSICVPLSNNNINSTGQQITEFHCATSSQIDSRIPIFSLKGCVINNVSNRYGCTDVTSSAGNNSIWQVYYTQVGGNRQNYTVSQTFYGGYDQYPHSIGQSGCPNSKINSSQVWCIISEPNYSANSLSNTFGFLAFLLGIILLIMSLGIYISGSVFASGFSFGLNAQGTKIAQVLGIGLTLWAFVSSEWSVWLFSIPLSLGVLIYSIFTILFFAGLYWQLVQ